MTDVNVEFSRITPLLRRRVCGGWLAVSPENAPLQIGVLGQSESDAREAFFVALARWEATIRSP